MTEPSDDDTERPNNLRAIANLTPALLSVSLREWQQARAGDVQNAEADAAPDLAVILEQMFTLEPSAWTVIHDLSLAVVGMIEFLCKEAGLDPAEFLETYALYLQTPDENPN